MRTRWAQRRSPSSKVQPKWSRLRRRTGRARDRSSGHFPVRLLFVVTELYRGQTQVRTAEEFGIDRSYISDMERGKKNVCLPTMEVLAQGFAISLSQLVRGLDRESPPETLMPSDCIKLGIRNV
jgi:hypothetical protein